MIILGQGSVYGAFKKLFLHTFYAGLLNNRSDVGPDNCKNCAVAQWNIKKEINAKRASLNVCFLLANVFI